MDGIASKCNFPNITVKYDLVILKELKILLKALVVKNSVLHDFGFGKVSPAKQL